MKNLKNKFILASAILALASCADNSYLGDQEEKTGTGGPISFGFEMPTPTRGTSEDAEKLSNQFIVYGEKNENSGSAPSTGNLVFQNYKVAYTASTAYTTTSNTNDWEYVGLSWTADEQNNITTSTTDAQTIKFWDDAASSYTFTAISALPDDISKGRIKITKTTSGTDQYAKGYSLTLAKTTEGNTDTYPDLTHLYFADRNNIPKGGGYNHSVVTMNFRNTLTQVRAGIYETIPGYNVIGINFYTSDKNNDNNLDLTTGHAFGAICKNTSTSGFEGTINVVYYGESDGDLKDKPKVTVNPDANIQKNDLILGNNFNTLTTTSTLGITSSQPTWDTSGGGYTAVLPQNSNENLKLTVDYTLYNSVSGETIEVTGKTAEVPAQYLQWKANYKYTYLFKITDDGLNPITFDAAVIEDAVGNAEYITTVSEPSITTFGYNTTTNKYITGSSDYPASTDVYATVEDNHTQPTLSAANMLLYTVSTTDATNFPMTEAAVAKYLIESPLKTKAVADAFKVKATASNDLTYVNKVKAEDGTDINMDGTNNKAAKFTTSASTTYAIVYQKTAPTYTWDSGQLYKDDDNDHNGAAFTAAGALYTRSGDGPSYTYTLATAYTSGTTYYKPLTLTSNGEYAVKIVTCPASN